MKARFRITYETVTDDSAINGDFAHHGFLPRTKNVPLHRNNFPTRPHLFTLREAADLLQPGGSASIEPDSSPGTPRWLTCQTTADWERPCVSLSLHLGNVSAASARRIARLFGVRVR